MSDSDAKMGELTQRLNDEFDRQKTQLGDAVEAAKRMDAYIDSIFPEYHGNRLLQSVLQDARSKYREFSHR